MIAPDFLTTFQTATVNPPYDYQCRLACGADETWSGVGCGKERFPRVARANARIILQRGRSRSRNSENTRDQFHCNVFYYKGAYHKTILLTQDHSSPIDARVDAQKSSLTPEERDYVRQLQNPYAELNFVDADAASSTSGPQIFSKKTSNNQNHEPHHTPSSR